MLDFKEVVNRIYDTLVSNVGMSKYHIPLDDITSSRVTAESGEIMIHFRNGKTYDIQITERKEAK